MPAFDPQTAVWNQAYQPVSPTVSERIRPAVRFPGPTGLAAKAGKEKILLAWEPPKTAGTFTYLIFRSDLELNLAPDPAEWPQPINREPVSETYFLDSAQASLIPPQPNVMYAYAVAAVDASGNTSLPSETIRILNQGQLSPPMGVEARAGDRSVTLSWQPPFSLGDQPLAGYLIYRSPQPGQQGEPLFTKPLQALTYSDQGTAAEPLQNCTEYYYTLFAKDQAGRLSPPVEQVAAMPCLLPTAPVQLTATGKTDDSIELQWVAGAAGSFPLTGYNIYRGSGKDAMDGPINKKPFFGTNYYDSEINSTSKPILGRYYTYVVRSLDQKGNESPDSQPAQATPRPPIDIPQSGLLSTAIPGLPPESSLTISGRKKIDLGYTAVSPSERTLAANSSLKSGFNLEQELQVKLQGKVGKKITVDVDYDDRTEEQRKISIIYAGDPDEVVQEAAFGDIRLDLPRTEFAGYNKDLFGAKLKVGLDNFRFTAIGAQTKGITVTEKFKGNASTRSLDIEDVNFEAFRYYYFTLDPGQVNHPELPNYISAQGKSGGLVPGSVMVYVTDGKNTAQTIRVEDAGNTRTMFFNLQSPGIDYNVDFERGILTFTNAIGYTAIVAVAYKYYTDAGKTQSASVGYDASGAMDFTPGRLKVPQDRKTNDNAHLLQDFNSNTMGSRDYRMMIMNRYSLGYQNILNPQTDPDFIIKVFSKSGAEVPLPQPSNPTESDKFYQIDPNFGLIRFRHHYPFQEGKILFSSDDYNDQGKDPYNPTQNARLGMGGTSAGNNYRIHVEFRNQISTFQLGHWNIIRNSEVIRKDGAKLRRDADYYMDYDTGLVSFVNPDTIASSTEITVAYEYLPFGGKFQSNLFGARAEYDLIGNNKWSVGSTFLYSSSQAPQDIPDVRSTPTSLSLIDGDSKLSLNPDDFSRLLSPFVPEAKIPVSVDVSAEGAYSNYEINTYRHAGENAVAMIDNMEGADNALSLPLDNNAWFPASAPSQFANTSPNDRKYITQSVKTDEPGYLSVDNNDKKTQLKWEFANMTSQTWDGFVYPISPSGSNLHDYKYLEILYFYEPADLAQQVVLHFDLGLISEDSNRNGNLNFEGDRLVLGPGNDVGIGNTLEFNQLNQAVVKPDPSGPRGIYPQGAPGGYWGEGNNRLNTEDLDRNDHLDITQSYYEYDKVLQRGWNIIKIPLTQFTNRLGDTLPTADIQSQQFLSFVKHCRLWVSGATAASASGFIKFQSIQLTGNKWQAQVAAGTRDQAGNLVAEPDANKFNVSTITLETPNGGYVPNTNFYIYDKNNADVELKNERALEIKYNLTRQDVVAQADGSTTEAYLLTRQLGTGNAYDYSNYRLLRVDVYKKAQVTNGEILFVRLGLDDNNYYQYHLSLDGVPVGAWHTLTVALDGSDGNRLARFQSNVIPGLNQVKQISLGISNPNSLGQDEILWVNNLRVSDGQARMGGAVRLTTNTKISDVLSVSTDYRDVDSDFLTIDEAPTGKQHLGNALTTVNITQWSFLPLNFNWQRTENYTEKERRSNPVYSNNFSVPDITNENVSGEINYTQLSGLDIAFRANQSRKVTEYLKVSVTAQSYNANSEEKVQNLNPSLAYTLPDRIFNFKIGSSTLNGNVVYRDTDLNYDTPVNRPDLYDRRTQSLEERYTYRGNYQPIEFISLSPGYTYSQSREQGNLSYYRYYNDLTSTPYWSDYYRLSRIEHIANMEVTLMKIPVFTPSASYSMTHVRDFVNDTLTIPNGSLTVRAGIDPGEPFGWNQFPKINWNRSYNVSATFQHNPLDAADPIGENENAFAFWWFDPLNFKASLADKFNQALINSKTISDAVNTNVYIFSDLSLTPQYTYNWAKKMNLQNFNTTQSMSLGSGLAWSRIPLLRELVNLESLNLDYQYRENQNFDTNNDKTSENIGHTASVNLPFRFMNDFTGNMSLGLNAGINNQFSKDQKGNMQKTVIIYQNQYDAGFSLAYNLRLLQPIRLPNFWPFMGAWLRLEQALRIVNDLKLSLVRNKGDDIPAQDLIANTTTNDTTFDYSLWRNVQGNLKITNQWYKNETYENKDYYAIGVSLGLSASF